MDFKPVPPDGKVYDLRKSPNQQKSAEDVEKEKYEKRMRSRRNLRIIAVVLAAYYFLSAGYSWWQENQRESNATIAANVQNPLSNPLAFRETFNKLINEIDTALPTANANDTPEGFIAVLSPAVEMQGYAKPNSKELMSVQIQTRYPDAFPPESVESFETFVLSCERMANPEASRAFADEILNSLSIIPKADANEDNKVFPQTVVHTAAYQYETTFTSGPIDELTLLVTPRINIESNSAQTQDIKLIVDPEAKEPAASATTANNDAAQGAQQAAQNAAGTDVQAQSDAQAAADAPSDVPALDPEQEALDKMQEDVPQL